MNSVLDSYLNPTKEFLGESSKFTLHDVIRIFRAINWHSVPRSSKIGVRMGDVIFENVPPVLNGLLLHVFPSQFVLPLQVASTIIVENKTAYFNLCVLMPHLERLDAAIQQRKSY